MVNLSPLESVASAFDHWRNTRTSRKQAVPTRLREQAIELLSQHKKSHVISALKINHSMLKRWQQKDDAVASGATFVALVNETPDPEASSCLQITLRNHLGGEMSITGDVTAAQLHSLAQLFAATQGTQS